MIKMGYEGKGLGKHSQGIVETIMVEERSKYQFWAMEKFMEKVLKPLRHLKQFQEGLLLQDKNLKHVKFAIKMNAIVSIPCCRKMVVDMQLMLSKRVVTTLMT